MKAILFRSMTTRTQRRMNRRFDRSDAMIQPTLFAGQNAYSEPITAGPRDGETFNATFDLARLNAQARRVYDVMIRGEWLTLAEVSELTGDPEASVSARLRDFRKPKFGGFTVERRRRGEAKAGLFEYRLVKP
jgi:hypothetical protein